MVLFGEDIFESFLEFFRLCFLYLPVVLKQDVKVNAVRSTVVILLLVNKNGERREERILLLFISAFENFLIACSFSKHGFIFNLTCLGKWRF